MRKNPVRPVITFFPTDDQAAEPKEFMNSHSRHKGLAEGEYRDWN
jgi:hypothetical protein